jgi:excisionase family DNA binding protein
MKQHIPKSKHTRLVTLQTAADELGISMWTLRDLVSSRNLKTVQPPGVRRIWIDRRDLDQAIESWKSSETSVGR